MNVDFIIVGQGLAGTLLAFALEEQGKTFCIIDDLNEYAASRKAAGIINPITGRRYVKSWNYDELEKEFVPFYEKLGNKIDKPIFQKHEIILCLSTIKEENDLLSQATRYHYLDKIKFIPFPSILISETRSAAYSLQGYKLDIQELCNAYRRYWTEKGYIRHQSVDYKFSFEQDKVIYHDIQADSVVFCEGAFIKQNPYFKHALVIPNKGQYLLITKDDWKGSYSVKDKIIISPISEGLWVGATYEWTFDTVEPDIKGKEELAIQLEKIIKTPYIIKTVLSGLRPTTQNRRPLIMRHPLHTNLWAINGFGTKGSSLGPYIINQFLKIYFEGIENKFENVQSLSI